MNLYKGKFEFEYIFVKEYERIYLVIFLWFCINRLLLWLFNAQHNLEEVDQLFKNGLPEDNYIRRIKTLKIIFIWKNAFGHFLICFLHLLYTYFIIIFGNIMSHIQIHLCISMILAFLFYATLYIIICLIISIFRFSALKCKNDFCSETCFRFSNFINNLVSNEKK